MNVISLVSDQLLVSSDAVVVSTSVCNSVLTEAEADSGPFANPTDVSKATENASRLRKDCEFVTDTPWVYFTFSENGLEPALLSAYHISSFQ